MVLTKEDKALIKEQYDLVWGEGTKMSSWAVGNTSGYIVMRDTIIVADKPSIQTRFCFGYGIYNDYDEVQARCTAARHDEGRFIQVNLSDCAARRNLERLDKYVPLLRGRLYRDQPDGCRLGYIEFVCPIDVNDSDRDCILTDDERARYREFLEAEVAKFEKRLHAYLKRYGLSKCDFWTYWQDE